MKDSNVEFKKWWEVIEEYFSKELEKNLTQYRANERKYKYKLKVYQRTFLDFVCGSPTSIETQGQDEENEVGLSGMVQKEEVQAKEPLILKGGGQEDNKPWMNQGP